MKILLDTHVLIWTLQDSPMLPFNIREAIVDENNEIYVSVLSLWEITIKHKNKPELMPFDATQIRDYAMRSGFIFLSLGLDAITTYDKYDLSAHKDPFDQMLICQSQAHNMRLLTHDKALKTYGIGFVELFWLMKGIIYIDTLFIYLYNNH